MKKAVKKVILDAKGMDRVLSRLTHEILEKNKGAEELALVGIWSGGVPLSKFIQEKIRQIEGIEVPVGFVDITLYRDDLSRAGYQPRLKRTEVPFSIDDRKVILVDDVLFTGRTIRAAMDALIGKALFIYFSIDWGRDVRWFEVWRYPEYVRWGRIGSVLR